MSACTRFAPMLSARAGELSGADAHALAEHLATCDACQARLADEAALAGMLSDALTAEANRRDFATFSDEVLARIPEYRDAPRRRGGFLDWVRHHRLVAALGGLAPALAALAIVVYVRGSHGPGDEVALQVSAESGVPMVLETADGPVVLLGDDEPAGS